MREKPETHESYRRPNNQGVTTEPGSVLVLFDDQSNMKIKTTVAAAV